MEFIPSSFEPQSKTSFVRSTVSGPRHRHSKREQILAPRAELTLMSAVRSSPQAEHGGSAYMAQTTARTRERYTILPLLLALPSRGFPCQKLGLSQVHSQMPSALPECGARASLSVCTPGTVPWHPRARELHHGPTSSQGILPSGRWRAAGKGGSASWVGSLKDEVAWRARRVLCQLKGHEL